MARLFAWPHGSGSVIITLMTSTSMAVVLLVGWAPTSGAEEGVEVRVTPTAIRFSSPEASEQLLVTLVSSDGKQSDRTRDVTYTTTSDGIVEVDERGRVTPVSKGRTTIVACWESITVSVEVEVEDLTNPAPISYQRDVIPILSKAGCNSGGCHGKAEGQNGFKLSVFGFDVIADHQALVLEGRGRRTMAAAPEQSLLLRKGTAELPHGGGRKLPEDSRWYRQLRRWIAEGAQLNPSTDDAPKEADTLVEIRVEPARLRLPPRGSQQLRVTARNAAGNWKCVTAEAEYQSNHDVVAEVDDDGWVMATEVPGEAAILVRYLGHVAVCRVTRPRLDVADFPRMPARNFIDVHVGEKLAELKVPPSETTTDAKFLRRVYLDTIGTLPTSDEARQFLLDNGLDKRSRLVGELLERPEHADYWAQRWADLLQLDVDTVSPPAVVAMVRWLREQVANNTPYDQFVRAILTAQGSTFRESPTPFFQVQADPEQLARSVSQLFLGVRIECAQCHHHPFERWDQKDYFALAGFFTGIQRLPSPRGGQKIVSRGGTALVHPRTGQPIPPAGLGAPAAELDDATDRRQALVDWMTDRENHWFPRTIVNRLWAHYLGRGLVEPVDDLRATNPASNEPLMDALAEHLLELDYDLKAFTRTLLDSHTYQLSSRSNDANQLDEQNYSHAAWKPIPAEVLLDAISQATGVAESFTGWPDGYRAIQVWDNKLPSHFLEVFGRPTRQTVCACERESEPSIAQALHLMNSSAILGKIQDPQGRAAYLASSSQSWDDVVEELYLATLSRFPTKDEKQLMGRILLETGDRREAAEDLLWTLLNTKEFIFNP